MRTDHKKTVFLDAYNSTLCDIGKSCLAAKINRSTYYYWYQKDEDFKTECENIDASFVDICESKLRDRIMKGEWIATKYYLENRAKGRWKHTEGVADVNLGGQLSVKITKEIIGGAK